MEMLGLHPVRGGHAACEKRKRSQPWVGSLGFPGGDLVGGPHTQEVLIKRWTSYEKAVGINN